MKQVFAILLMVTFLAEGLTPFIPYIDYAIHKNYIAKELCENVNKPELNCQGKCHLNKEIKKIVRKSQNKKVPSPFGTKNNNEQRVYFFEETVNHKVLFRNLTRLSIPYLINLNDINFDIITPPPQLIS